MKWSFSAEKLTISSHKSNRNGFQQFSSIFDNHETTTTLEWRREKSGKVKVAALSVSKSVQECSTTLGIAL
jgi:hypothetical protein